MELTHLPTPVWCIEGLFEVGSLTMVAGPSGAFKSLLLLDWLLCMASGRKWNGRATVPGKVGYVLGEGKSGLLKRIRGWITYNKPTPEELESLGLNFRVSFEMPQLASKASVDNMLADLEKEDFKPSVIGIDTFARSMVGMDEDKAKDAGLWIESADRLRQLGYGVVFVHHTKKNTEFGAVYRGSSAIFGAMDTAMVLTRTDKTCKLVINKQKDHDEGPPMRFNLVDVPLTDDKGQLTGEKSAVLVPSPQVDHRFTEEAMADRPHVDINLIINELLEDASYESDRARARELARRVGFTEGAAQARISRTQSLRKDH